MNKGSPTDLFSLEVESRYGQGWFLEDLGNWSFWQWYIRMSLENRSDHSFGQNKKRIQMEMDMRSVSGRADYSANRTSDQSCTAELVFSEWQQFLHIISSQVDMNRLCLYKSDRFFKDFQMILLLLWISNFKKSFFRRSFKQPFTTKPSKCIF